MRYEKRLLAESALVGFSLLVIACAEPQCPQGFQKLGMICKRLDAGSSVDEAGALADDDGGVASNDGTAPEDDATMSSRSDAAVQPSDAAAQEASIGATSEAGSDAATSTIDAATPDSAASGAGSDAAPTCGAGHVIKNGVCQDIDECFEGTHECHMTASCKNTDGSYDCTCPLGYSGGTSAGFACAPRIAVGVGFACALQSDGRVKCWGGNADGQLGDGTKLSRLTPVFVTGLDHVVAIAAHDSASACALRNDGKVLCWGQNPSGQLGDGSTLSRPTPGPVTAVSDARALSVGYGQACAVLKGGAVWCWGSKSVNFGQPATETKLLPMLVTGLPAAASVAAGIAHACAVTPSGTVWCWGENGLGQLGSGTTTASDLPLQATGVRDALFATSGVAQTCILRADQKAVCWGYGVATPTVVARFGSVRSVCSTDEVTFSVLQDGSVTSAQTQLDNGLRGTTGPIDAVAAAALSVSAACAAIKDGSVRCWGNNASGQLGDGTTTAVAMVTQGQQPVTTVSGLHLW